VIGGLIIDLLVIGAVLSFAWVAPQLGGLSSLGRLAECVAAFTVAALLRDPAGSLVQQVLGGASDDFSRLVGMILVALATAIAAHSIFRWWRGRRVTARSVEDEHDGIERVEEDPLDQPTVARLAGGTLGLGWALLFVALLVLQPSNTPISRAAIDSRLGGALIDQEAGLRWLNDGFPHYTQALPKGKLGAIVGERAGLPMREPVEPTEQAGDPDELLRSVNDLRRYLRVRVLAFNPDIAAVARRHASALAEERQLSYRSPGGGTLDSRVRAALGESSGSFSEEVGIEVVWAHDAATAFRGLLESRRAQSVMRDGQWSEVGIGVVDAGWFNGRIYVLLLVGPEPEAAAPATDDGDLGAAAAAGSVEDTTASEFLPVE
jgi:uncharacterized protein YkwD